MSDLDIIQEVQKLDEEKKKTLLREQAYIWIMLLVDSLYSEFRTQEKFNISDQIREHLKNLGIQARDIPVKELKEYKEGYSKHRGMPGASLVELEMF